LSFSPDTLGRFAAAAIFLLPAHNSVRDGEQAVRDAETALEVAKADGKLDGSWYERMLNRLLAAAHAENGDFDRAIDIETKSLKLAITKSATNRINEHIEKYRNCEPIRSETGIG